VTPRKGGFMISFSPGWQACHGARMVKDALHACLQLRVAHPHQDQGTNDLNNDQHWLPQSG